MWSWLQKLMSFFQGEEEKRIEDEVRPSSTPAPRQLQAKTKSIYPKERESNRAYDESRPDKQRQFRFPVVPDDYLEQIRKEREKEKYAQKAKQPSPRERAGNSRDMAPATREGIPAPVTEAKIAKQAPNPVARNREPARRQMETHSDVSNHNQLSGEEKRPYQPSEIVSPVYGKITPATREAEHRIHTTGGIVYPRLEQEEHLNQLKQWEQREHDTQAVFEEKDVPTFFEERRSTIVVEPAWQAIQEAAEEVAVTAGLVEQPAPAALEEIVEIGADLITEAEAVIVSDEVVVGEWEPAADIATVGVAEPEATAEIDDVVAVEPEATAEIDDVVAVEPEATADTDTVTIDGVEAGTEQDEHAGEQVDTEASFATVSESEADSGDVTLGSDDLGKYAAIFGQVEIPSAEPIEEAQPPFAPALTRLLERSESDQQADTPEAEAVIQQSPSVAPLTERPKQEQEAVAGEEPAYCLPQLELLNPSPPPSDDDDEHTQLQKLLLEETLSNFNVSAQVVGIVKGPSVTRFELQPAPGVKVNKITGLVDDIKLNLAAKDIRIEAPIPGRNAIGIEVPNLSSQPVMISKIIGSEKFQQHTSPLSVALGMDIGGEPIIADIKKMPHGLIAGSTGSGKSVCINSIIVSLLYKATPEQVRLLLIDPKMVELAPYNHLPHLVTPVVTEAKQATAALKWAVEEMEKRYALFVDAGVRDIDRYNQTTDDLLPFIVIVIDELADLMMVSPQDVEDCIIRIAQKARACGIHLLLATQRPSVDVITGNIKANVPTRLAFAVFSQVDSRTILDQSGAERLLGRGDMLFLESGTTPVRLQGNYVSDDEIERITQVIKKQRKPAYIFSKEDLEQQVQSFDMGEDPLYLEALVFVADQGHASASGLQRRFRVGYNRAARLIEMMEADGYVAGQSGGKARAVLITREDAQAVAEGSTLV